MFCKKVIIVKKLKVIDDNKYEQKEKKDTYKYRFYGIIEHHGDSPYTGHYTSYVRSDEE